MRSNKISWMILAVNIFVLSGCLVFPPSITPTQTVSQPTTTSDIVKSTLGPDEIWQNECNPYQLDTRSPVNALNPSYSPNGEWHSVFCLDNQGFSVTRFINRDRKLTRDVSYYDSFWAISDQKAQNKDGQMLIERWSEDGQYVYLRSYWCCLDGPGMLFVNVFALYRMKLSDGQLEKIVANSSSIRFSSDETYLVYSSILEDSNIIISVRNLNTGYVENFQMGKKYVSVGLFTWSSQNTDILFVGALDGWESSLDSPTIENKNGFSLLLLNLETAQIKTLIENDVRLLRPLDENAWVNEHIVKLLDVNGQIYEFDIEKLKLTQTDS